MCHGFYSDNGAGPRWKVKGCAAGRRSDSLATPMNMVVAGSFVLAIDQCTKWMVRTRPAMWFPLTSIARIRPVSTERLSFRRRRGRVVFVLSWLTALTATLLLVRTGAGLQTEVSRVGVGLSLGGAAGNLLDILRRRSVTDFIDLGWWPAFNMADVAIVAGLALAFWPRE